MTAWGLQATGAALAAIDRHVPQLASERFASRLAAQDPGLWGQAAQEEASKRLGWVDPFEHARALLPQISQLRSELQADGITRVVLAGMGGSSLAPEVIAATDGVPLTVLDSTDPEMVGNVLGTGVTDTVLVVSSKSGSTVETDSQRRAFEQAFTDAGQDPARHIVVVTDPGSPLEQAATEAGYRRVFTADPNVGGRYSALTAFGLVPTGLAGAELVRLLDDAEDALGALAEDDADNPALQLGAALGGTDPLRNKVVFADTGSGIHGLADWAEQLIAESTGKDGTGLLPVVVDLGDPETVSSAADLLQVRLVPDPADDDGMDETERAEAATEVPTGGDAVEVFGPLGAQFVLWEVATAVAGRLLGINPFDQPDVEAAKAAARGLLDATPAPAGPDAVVGDVQLSGPAELTSHASSAGLRAVLDAAIGRIPERGYLAVQAYLDRLGYPELEELRPALAKLSGRPVTFGWGPRFLHSTGQFHKGGPAEGVFIQLTADSDLDLGIPGRPFTFGELIGAQAAGDASVLLDQGSTVLRLHLTERGAGIAQLLDAVRDA